MFQNLHIHLECMAINRYTLIYHMSETVQLIKEKYLACV